MNFYSLCRIFLIPLTLSALLLGASALGAGKPSLPEIDDKAAAKLDKGKIVLTSKRANEDEEAEANVRVTGLVKIAAQPADIWKMLVEPEQLVAGSKNITDVTEYGDGIVTHANGDKSMNLKMYMEVLGFNKSWHIYREFHQTENYLTWALDKSQTNDIEWNKGSYSLFPSEQDGAYILLYSLEVSTGYKVPKWIEEELVQGSLKKHLRHVKKNAEAAAS